MMMVLIIGGVSVVVSWVDDVLLICSHGFSLFLSVCPPWCLSVGAWLIGSSGAVVNARRDVFV